MPARLVSSIPSLPGRQSLSYTHLQVSLEPAVPLANTKGMASG